RAGHGELRDPPRRRHRRREAQAGRGVSPSHPARLVALRAARPGHEADCRVGALGQRRGAPAGFVEHARARRTEGPAPARLTCMNRRAAVAFAACFFAARAAAITPDAFYAKAAPSVWLVKTFDADGLPLSVGSAVVVAPDTLLTNCHVLAK